MMMRYLGWGIGHHNPPDFAHEADALIASSSDRELSRYEEQEAMYHIEIAGDVEVEAGGVGDVDEAADVEDFDDMFEY